MARVTTNRRGTWRPAAVGLLMLAGLAIGAAVPAAAAGDTITVRNGVCEQGEFCYYYNSNAKGSVSDFPMSNTAYRRLNLGSGPNCYVFKGAGAGRGLCVKNNAAAARNNTDRAVRVYYNSDQKGAWIDVCPGNWANLGPLKNQNASHLYNPSNPSCISGTSSG